MRHWVWFPSPNKFLKVYWSLIYETDLGVKRKDQSYHFLLCCASQRRGLCNKTVWVGGVGGYKIEIGVGEMAKCLRALATLPEVLSLILRTHARQITTFCKSSSRALIPLASLGICTHMPVPTCKHTHSPHVFVKNLFPEFFCIALPVLEHTL